MSNMTKAVRSVSAKELEECTIPAATKTYRPYVHHEYHRKITDTLKKAGYKIKDRQLMLSYDGTRMFCRATLDHKTMVLDKEYDLMVGYRNSYDKSCAAGFGIGATVMVCSNMSFYADLMVQHKHTLNVIRAMEHMVASAVDRIQTQYQQQSTFFDGLKMRKLKKVTSQEIMLAAVRNRIIGAKELNIVMKETSNPSFDYGDYDSNSAWILYNAFTTAMKGQFNHRPIQAMNQSMALTSLFEGVK